MLEFKTGKLYKYNDLGTGTYSIIDWADDMTFSYLTNGDIFTVLSPDVEWADHKILIRNRIYRLWLPAYKYKHFREVKCSK
jgi:hypothetical protein